MNHLSFQQFLEFAAGETPPELRQHLRECNDCRSRMKEFEKVEFALHQVRTDDTPADFTEKVMRRLGIGSAPSLLWTMFNGLAPLIALAVVSGIAVAALNYFDVFHVSGIQQTPSGLQSVSGKIATGLGGGITAFNQWIGRYVAFAKNSYGLTTFIVCLFGAVALLDKYILMPRMRKKGM